MASYLDYDNKDKKLYDEVDKLKNGDTAAYDTVYKLSQKYIYKLIMDVVNDFSVTECIMQDVYNQIYNRIATLRNSKTFYVWAGRIATDLTLSYIKNNKPEMLEADLQACIDDGTFVVNRAYEDIEEFIPEGVVTDTNKLNFIFSILDGMSTGQKITVQYFYYQEMSIAEIMDKMDCTVNVVKGRLIYAKNLIKRALEECGAVAETRMYNLGTIPIFWLTFRNGYESLIFTTDEEDDSEKTSMLYDRMGVSGANVVPGYGAMGGSGAIGASNVAPQDKVAFVEQTSMPVTDNVNASVSSAISEMSVSNSVNNIKSNNKKKSIIIAFVIILVLFVGLVVCLLIKYLRNDNTNGGGQDDEVATQMDATQLDATPLDTTSVDELLDEIESNEDILTEEVIIDEILDVIPQEATPTDITDEENSNSAGTDSR